MSRNALPLNVTTDRLPGMGELPVTFVSSIVPTVRPSDEVIIMNTEISGRDAFEEVVDMQAITNLKDPFKEKLMELAQQAGVKVG